jgi:hypothetical protein
MHLDLSDEESAALTRLLRKAIDDDRFPVSPRMRLLQGVLDKLERSRVRNLLPPLKTYAPPHVVRGRRRR